MTDGLKPKQRETIIATLSANPKVERIVLFGSRAMGTFTPTSDIDIALFGDDLTLSDQAALSEEMAELSIPQRVDILIYHRIENQALREHIRKHGVEWFARRRGASMASTTGGEWRRTTLGDVLILQRGFDLPETERKPGPHPVIASTGPVGTHDVAMAQGPGVVIGRSGSLGGGQFIEADFWPLNTTLWVKDFKGNDRRFCYYLLKSLDLAHFNAGSGVPTLNRNHIHPLPVFVPTDPDEQRAIACILGALDDKIELNRRMSETLEAMARAIFKSWFVDFEPVRAKAAVRREHPDWTNEQVSRAACPNLKPEIAALFPDSFEDSELGEIPMGWKVGTMGDVAGLLSGFAFKSKDWIEEGVPVVKIGSVKPGIVDLDQVSYVSQDTATLAIRYRLNVGDLLIGMTGYVGEVGLVPPTDKLPLLNQRVGKFVLEKKGSQGLGFVYCTTRRPEFKASVETRSHGTAQANVSAQGILSVPIVVPTKVVRNRFDEVCAPFFEKLLANHKETRTLAALRDTLLPKLISGALRVKDAERIAGRCV